MSEETATTAAAPENASQDLQKVAERLKAADASEDFVAFAEQAVGAVTELEDAYTKLATEHEQLTEKLTAAEKSLETAKKASESGKPAAVSDTLVESITAQVKAAHNLTDLETKKFSEEIRCNPEYAAKYLDQLLKSSTAAPTGRGINSDDAGTQSEFFDKAASASDPESDAEQAHINACLRDGVN